jgi:hypothetical protein
MRRQSPPRGLLALIGNLHGHLIGRAADAAALDLKARAGVLQRTDHQVHRVAFAELLAHPLKRTVDDALGEALLAALHDDVDQMRNQRAAVTDVRNGLPLNCSVTA